MVITCRDGDGVGQPADGYGGVAIGGSPVPELSGPVISPTLCGSVVKNNAGVLAPRGDEGGVGQSADGYGGVARGGSPVPELPVPIVPPAIHGAIIKKSARQVFSRGNPGYGTTVVHELTMDVTQQSAKNISQGMAGLFVQIFAVALLDSLLDDAVSTKSVTPGKIIQTMVGATQHPRVVSQAFTGVIVQVVPVALLDSPLDDAVSTKSVTPGKIKQAMVGATQYPRVVPQAFTDMIVLIVPVAFFSVGTLDDAVPAAAHRHAEGLVEGLAILRTQQLSPVVTQTTASVSVQLVSVACFPFIQNAVAALPRTRTGVKAAISSALQGTPGETQFLTGFVVQVIPVALFPVIALNQSVPTPGAATGTVIRAVFMASQYTICIVMTQRCAGGISYIPVTIFAGIHESVSTSVHDCGFGFAGQLGNGKQEKNEQKRNEPHNHLLQEKGCSGRSYGLTI